MSRLERAPVARKTAFVIFSSMSLSKLFDSQNAGYAQELYEQYSKNPLSVPAAWREIFARGTAEVVEAGLLVPEALSSNGGTVGARPPDTAADSSGSTTASSTAPTGLPASTTAASASLAVPSTSPVVPSASPAELEKAARRAIRVAEGLLPLVAQATGLVQAFRDHGHQLSQIDPLGSEPPGHPQLDPSFFGTSMEELEALPASAILGEGGDERLADYLRRLQEAYCGSIGYQFEHLEDPERVRWLWSEVESGVHARPLDRDEKVWLLQRLSDAEGLEHFLHRTYLGQKRFSLEGNDMLVPMLDLALEEAVRDGCREVVLGMAHRGRLNVLAHTVGVGYEEVLREFEGTPAKRNGVLTVPESGTGDVKYHRGAEGEHALRDGGAVRVTLAPNPSHLEFVNPVVAGLARARQFGGTGQDDAPDSTVVVPLMIHGDAAFAAEGVVAETLNLARLRGYTTGGVVHVIVNNQIGFTTDPADGRSTRYASDLAKGYDIPVLRVNADDPPACLAAVRLAMAYRAKFQDDVVIDLIGYRRHGHNEGDEPAYTQPRLYELIHGHPTVRTQWADALVAEGTMTAEDVAAMEKALSDRLRDAQEAVKGPQPDGEPEEGVRSGSMDGPIATHVAFADLAEINAASMAVPDGFTIHPKLRRQLDKNRGDFTEESVLEWAHGETLAIGSLLREGVPVRLTGQDAQRGTFSQRHLVFHDPETGATHAPLAALGNARFEVYNSPLSETAVLGFEYGYSVGADVELVLWEAQFGDFVNVAQPIIDQFIASGQSKWGQLSRLTLLLPHGYEGQGPEHSSARLERFLQMCAEGNMRVVYPTTPAQYFHLLRLQAHAPERPLVVMTPKSLLRHPLAGSPASELSRGGFHPVLPDPDSEARTDGVTRLVLCTGKVYYDLAASDERAAAAHVAVARVEQLYPFPGDEIEELVRRYPNLEEAIWTQEEPRNMGALSYIGPRLRAAVPRTVPLRYLARPEWASPAEGKASDHATEQRRIIQEAFAS